MTHCLKLAGRPLTFFDWPTGSVNCCRKAWVQTSVGRPFLTADSSQLDEYKTKVQACVEVLSQRNWDSVVVGAGGGLAWVRSTVLAVANSSAVETGRSRDESLTLSLGTWVRNNYAALGDLWIKGQDSCVGGGVTGR